MVTIVTRGAEEAARNLERAAREMPSRIEQGVKLASFYLSRETVLQLSGPKNDHAFLGRIGAPAPFLGARSGFTRGRITKGGQVFRSGNVVFSPVGSPDRHVAFHDKGGTILPKRGKYLRIPLKEMETDAGVDRLRGASARTLARGFIFKSKKGNLFIGTRGRSKELVPLYLLKTSVTLPPRGMFQAVRERATPTINRIVGAEVEVVVRRANGG